MCHKHLSCVLERHSREHKSRREVGHPRGGHVVGAFFGRNSTQLVLKETLANLFEHCRISELASQESGLDS